MNLKPDHELERSGVVANCCMNRERKLTGSNSYTKELGFNPLEFLIERATKNDTASWLDLCCGSGKALIEAAGVLERENRTEEIQIVGVDLIRHEATPSKACLTFVMASLATWQPESKFDLITCIHGLHYIGDKLGLIARVASWLIPAGQFIANLDLNNIEVRADSDSTRLMTAAIRKNGLEWNSRKKLLSCQGHKQIAWPYEYLGADDQAGPNYTGQAAVRSVYACTHTQS